MQMRIVHIAPNAPYNDYWGYQENLLPKYQKKMGHDVTVIITNTEHRNESIQEIPCARYELSDGEHIIRLSRKQYGVGIINSLKAYIPVYHELQRIKPDLVFFHGLLSSSIFDVIRYKKGHPNCIIVQDNHLDYNIGFGEKGIKNRLIRLYFRIKNKRSIKYIERVYGVTPWRKTYAEDYFGIPRAKTDVLIMGADDEKIDFSNKESIRNNIRKKYSINENDFLIVTGGKIDKKKKIDILMEACSGYSKIKLLVFGNIANDVRDKLEKLISENKNIIYIGWINSDDVYNYYFAADLVFFPGQHSVLWEQACASKVPCVFERWEGMEHVNNGGNSDFVDTIDVTTIRAKIEELLFTEKYFDMKKVANSDMNDIYMYSKIAEKSLECVSGK